MLQLSICKGKLRHSSRTKHHRLLKLVRAWIKMGKTKPVKQHKCSEVAQVLKHVRLGPGKGDFNFRYLCIFGCKLLGIVSTSVNPSPRAENTAFVSLASEAYGVKVIGYPLDVGEIRGDSGALKVFGDLVWRTSKRSSVCYVTSSPCASRKSVQEAMLPAAEKPFVKLHKNSEKASNKSCVPVELIFSKILAAVD
ncbi:hypothetical protein SASPL_143329 [Salvia splendens]|uniref:Uncharacterized protein n=1 Tax=Salvia splendens TaxID=180675 RepID=A0A8X8WNF5_SALSN|nr:hypothetical protein SASPL_143329 [Salvia splendens]